LTWTDESGHYSLKIEANETRFNRLAIVRPSTPCFLESEGSHMWLNWRDDLPMFNPPPFRQHRESPS
jgi:hypothetical protein